MWKKMFDSSKNDLAQKVLFGERVKTLLFISMATELPLSILLVMRKQKLNQGMVVRGVTELVSPGTGADWERCVTCSFTLNSYDNIWFDIEDVYAVSFSNIQSPQGFLKHEMSLIKIQHLGTVYSSSTGRRKIDIEIGGGNDSQYYKIISSLSYCKKDSE